MLRADVTLLSIHTCMRRCYITGLRYMSVPICTAFILANGAAILACKDSLASNIPFFLNFISQNTLYMTISIHSCLDKLNILTTCNPGNEQEE